MKKLAALLLALMTVIGLLAGCAGTPVVYYTDCTCPVEAHAPAAPAEPVIPLPDPTEGPAAFGSGLKTGLYDYHVPYQTGGTKIVLNGADFAVSHVPSLVRCGALPGRAPMFDHFLEFGDE